MDPYQVLLLILILVVFFYLALVVYVVGKMREFRLRLRAKLRGLNLLLYERSEVLQSLYNLFREREIVFADEEKEIFGSLRQMTFSHSKEEEVRAAMNAVKTATSRIRYYAQANQLIMLEPQYIKSMELLDDLERNYRTLTSQYNADVMAYNYWIRIPTVSWFGYIIGYRKKLYIS